MLWNLVHLFFFNIAAKKIWNIVSCLLFHKDHPRHFWSDLSDIKVSMRKELVVSSLVFLILRNLFVSIKVSIPSSSWVFVADCLDVIVCLSVVIPYDLYFLCWNNNQCYYWYNSFLLLIRKLNWLRWTKLFIHLSSSPNGLRLNVNKFNFLFYIRFLIILVLFRR